jgi:osmotically-inducible protein OsmY
MATARRRRIAMMKCLGYPALVVMLAVQLGGCGALTEESKRGHFDDGTITSAVEKTLAADQRAAFTSVVVYTASGTVYLTGSVADTDAKQRATDLAKQVAGVRQVINNVQLGTGAPA